MSVPAASVVPLARFAHVQVMVVVVDPSVSQNGGVSAAFESASADL